MQFKQVYTKDRERLELILQYLNQLLRSGAASASATIPMSVSTVKERLSRISNEFNNMYSMTDGTKAANESAIPWYCLDFLYIALDKTSDETIQGLLDTKTNKDLITLRDDVEILIKRLDESIADLQRLELLATAIEESEQAQNKCRKLLDEMQAAAVFPKTAVVDYIMARLDSTPVQLFKDGKLKEGFKNVRDREVKLGYDIDILYPVDEAEFNQYLDNWKQLEEKNRLLLMYSPADKLWKAYLIADDIKVVREKTITSASTVSIISKLDKILKTIDLVKWGKPDYQKKFKLSICAILDSEKTSLFERYNFKYGYEYIYPFAITADKKSKMHKPFSSTSRDKRRGEVDRATEQELKAVLEEDLKVLQTRGDELKTKYQKPLEDKMVPWVQNLGSKVDRYPVLWSIFCKAYEAIASQELMSLASITLNPTDFTDRAVMVDLIARIGEISAHFSKEFKEEANLNPWISCRTPIYHALDFPASHEQLKTIITTQTDLLTLIYKKDFPELQIFMQKIFSQESSKRQILSAEYVEKLHRTLEKEVQPLYQKEETVPVKIRFEYLLQFIKDMQLFIKSLPESVGNDKEKVLSYEDYLAVLAKYFGGPDGNRRQAYLILKLKEFGQAVRQLPHYEQIYYPRYAESYVKQKKLLSAEEFEIFKQLALAETSGEAAKRNEKNIIMILLEYRELRGALAHRLNIAPKELAQKIAFLLTSGFGVLSQFNNKLNQMLTKSASAVEVPAEKTEKATDAALVGKLGVLAAKEKPEEPRKEGAKTATTPLSGKDLPKPEEKPGPTK